MYNLIKDIILKESSIVKFRPFINETTHKPIVLSGIVKSPNTTIPKEEKINILTDETLTKLDKTCLLTLLVAGYNLESFIYASFENLITPFMGERR